MQPLTEKDVEGLRKSIAIVQKHLYLCTEKQKEIGDGLQKAIRSLNAVGGKVIIPGGEGKEEKTAKDILGQLKKDADELLKKVKNQKIILEDFQKEEYISTEVDAKIEKTIKNIGTLKEVYQDAQKKGGKLDLQTTQLQKEINKGLDEITKLIAIEQRMGRRQAIALSQVLTLEEEIKAAVKKADKIEDTLIQLTKGQANKENPFYESLEQLERTREILKNIEEEVSKEDGTVRLLVQVLEEREKREVKTKEDIKEKKNIVDGFYKLFIRGEGDVIIKEIANVEELMRTDAETIKQADTRILYGTWLLKELFNKLLPMIVELEGNIGSLLKIKGK